MHAQERGGGAGSGGSAAASVGARVAPAGATRVVSVPFASVPSGTRRYAEESADGLLSRRTELVLQELDSLPTLPVVATRLIELGSREDVPVRDIVRLIEVDPPLTAKLLGLCRKAATRTRYPITTVEMAVVMLGLDAVRSLVLSVQVFEWAQSTPRRAKAPSKPATGARPGTGGTGAGEFDRTGFWQHSIAVASCADLIAREHPELDIAPEEAFVCGLVHDLGKLALDLVLPKAYARVIELSESRQGNIADFERPILGIDHTGAGGRLAQRWNLPPLLAEVMRGHHAAFEDLDPAMDGANDSSGPANQRQIVALVGLADALARKLGLGWSGNHAPVENDRALAEAAGFSWARIERVLPRVYESTSLRCRDLGLGEEPSQQLLIDSILRANSRLGQLNSQLAECNQHLRDAQERMTQARAMACLGEMTAGAAHEMNNPLATISGRAQTLRQRASSEQERASADAIVEAAGRLGALVHRLHRVANPPKPVPQATDLKPLLESVVVRAKAKAAERVKVSPILAIRVAVADSLGPARIDPEILGDALSEIVVNAIEAGPRTCVEVRAVESDEGELVIEISDDGCGMSPHVLEHATDPFFSEKPAGRQSGLGLALAHRLLEALGAGLSLTSRQGKGTAATIRISQWRWTAQSGTRATPLAA